MDKEFFKKEAEQNFEKYLPFFPWASEFAQLQKTISYKQNNGAINNIKQKVLLTHKIKKLVERVNKNQEVDQTQFMALPLSQFFKQVLQFLNNIIKQFYENKWLQHICKFSPIDDDEPQATIEEINCYFQSIKAHFEEREDDFSEYKLQEYSKGMVYLPQTTCLNCLNEIIPKYDFKNFSEKINYIFIKRWKLSQKLNSILIGLLNSGGGLIFIVNKYVNDQILSGFERKTLLDLIESYFEVKQFYNAKKYSIQPEDQFTIEESVVKLLVKDKQQFVLKLSVFPKSDSFRMFYQKKAQKVYFYEFFPEIPKLYLVPTGKIFDSLKKRRKRRILHGDLPCQQGQSICDFHEQHRHHPGAQSENNEPIDEFQLRRGFINLLILIEDRLEKGYKICVFVPHNEKAAQDLQHCLEEYKKDNSSACYLIEARKFIKEVIKNLKPTKEIYFLFYRFPDASIQSLSDRKELEGSQFVSLATRIELNKSLTESCAQKFNRMVTFLIEKGLVKQRVAFKYAKRQYQKALKDFVLLKPVIHCINSKHKFWITFMVLLIYAFMHYHQFKPILKELPEKIPVSKMM